MEAQKSSSRGAHKKRKEINAVNILEIEKNRRGRKRKTEIY